MLPKLGKVYRRPRRMFRWANQRAGSAGTSIPPRWREAKPSRDPGQENGEPRLEGAPGQGFRKGFVWCMSRPAESPVTFLHPLKAAPHDARAEYILAGQKPQLTESQGMPKVKRAQILPPFTHGGRRRASGGGRAAVVQGAPPRGMRGFAAFVDRRGAFSESASCDARGE